VNRHMKLKLMFSKECVYWLDSCDSHGSPPVIICECDNIRVAQNDVQDKLAQVTILSNRTLEVCIKHVAWDSC